MPKIFGLNLIAIIVATLIYYFVGFLWYGFLFMEPWMASQGLSADNDPGNPLWMIGGFLITIPQVIGVGKAMQWRKVSSLGGAIGTALLLWVMFAVPFVHYEYLYVPAHNAVLLMIDMSHFLVGFVLSAIIFKLFKP